MVAEPEVPRDLAQGHEWAPQPICGLEGDCHFSPWEGGESEAGVPSNPPSPCWHKDLR